MNTTALDLEDCRYELDDGEDVLGLAKSLINGHHPGILATMDEEGRPQMRWMSSLEVDELPMLRTLTNPSSRKVAQIQANPKVSWMFFNKDKSLILTLRGEARIIDEPASLKETWQKVVDLSLTYFLDRYSHKLGFVVIETKIDTVELNSPTNGVRFEVPPMELVHLH